MNIFLFVLMILLYTFQSYFCKLYSNVCKTDRATTPVFNAIFGSVIGFVTLFVYGFQFEASAATWIFGLCNAVLLFLYNTSLIGASTRGSYAFLNIVSMFGSTILPIIAAVFLWGDSLTGMQIFGILLMLFSFVVINIKGISFKGTEGAYYLFCLLLFLSNGLFSTILDAQSRVTEAAGSMERGEMIMITYLCSTVISLGYIGITERKESLKVFRIGWKALVFALSSGAVAVAAVNLLMHLLTRIESSILYPVNNGAILVLSVILAAIGLREKLKKHQIIGIVLSVISIILLNL